MPSKDSKEEKKEKAREVVDILEEISLLLVSLFMPFSAFGLTPGYLQEHPAGSATTITLRFTHRERR